MERKKWLPRDILETTPWNYGQKMNGSATTTRKPIRIVQVNLRGKMEYSELYLCVVSGIYRFGFG